MTRDPPGDVEAERSVLGALLLGPTVGVDVHAVVVELGLRPGDLVAARHQHIAAAIFAVHDRGDPVDTILVAEELRRDGLLDEVGGIDTLHSLQNNTPTVSNVAKHAKIVLRHARRRRIIHLAAEVSQGAYDDEDDRTDRALAELAATAALVATSRLDPSWQPVDLAAVLAGDLRRPEPSVLQRDDGRALFYGGMVNGVHGDSGIGKGWMLCHAIAGELAAGATVLLVDLEDVADSVMTRLHDLGVTNALILEHLVYVRPHTPFDDDAVREVLRIVADRDVSLAIVDSLGEAFGLEGIDENKDAEVGPWMRRVARAVAEAGPAVVLTDHSTKAADNPLHPSGSKRKRAAIGGASYLVEAVVPLAKGRGGRLRITCAKDRHGNYARAEVVGSLVMTCPGDDVRIVIYAPDDSPDLAGELPAILVARDVVRVVRESAELLSKRAVVGLLTAKASTDMKWAGLSLAVDTGALAVDLGPRGSHLLRYVHDLDPELGK